jgi:hypothetical protein
MCRVVSSENQNVKEAAMKSKRILLTASLVARSKELLLAKGETTIQNADTEGARHAKN